MTEPTPFQMATVDAAEATLERRNGPRRFLVADEVGLGKTIVAQQLIRHMMNSRRRPVVVFYVCSSLSVASQNRAKLLELLPEDERSDAQCEVDRLTLMPAAEPPRHPRLHLYTLTPATSIPVRKGIRRDGRVEERALVHSLVEVLWPRFFERRSATYFRRQAHYSWEWAQRYRSQHPPSPRLRERFRESVRTEFKIGPGGHVLPILLQVTDALELIAHLRNALAASAIENVAPDLAIFDEFQRFRDLMSRDEDEAAARVVGALRGETAGSHAALLLLSATPYRLYAQRWEEETGTRHHAEFFDVVEFLYGRG